MAKKRKRKGETQAVLRGIAGAKIIVVGDLCLDVWKQGKVSRLSPEAPVPIFEQVSSELRLGMAGNVGANVTALGGKATVITVIGDGDEGAVVAWDIAKLCKLKFLGIKDGKRRTATKTRFVASGQQIMRFDDEVTSPIAGVTEAAVCSAIMGEAKGAVVILQDHGKGVVTPAVIQACARVAKLVIVDPSPKVRPTVYKGCQVMMPNLPELESMVGGTLDNVNKLLAGASNVVAAVGLQEIVVTLAEQGALLYQAGAKKAHVFPTEAKTVFDVCGAGDTMIAAYALARASGYGSDEAVRFGNLAAGVVVGKRGTATATPREVLDLIRD